MTGIVILHFNAELSSHCIDGSTVRNLIRFVGMDSCQSHQVLLVVTDDTLAVHYRSWCSVEIF